MVWFLYSNSRISSNAMLRWEMRWECLDEKMRNQEASKMMLQFNVTIYSGIWILGSEWFKSVIQGWIVVFEYRTPGIWMVQESYSRLNSGIWISYRLGIWMVQEYYPRLNSGISSLHWIISLSFCLFSYNGVKLN